MSRVAIGNEHRNGSTTKGTTVLLVTTLIFLIAIGSHDAGGAQPPEDTAATLRVAGRSSATPWVASLGSFVAVVWGASTADGKTDVFVAASRDAGRTFGAPARVNAHAGEAQLKGERTPRVALVAVGKAPWPEIVVLWTAKADQNVVRLARSSDGGLTFGAAIDLQGSSAAGNRGWASLAVDVRGVAHAFWLDHRDAAMPAGMTHAHGAAHVPGPTASVASEAPKDPVALAQRSGLYYASESRDAVLPGEAPGHRPAERELARGVCYCCKTSAAAGPGGSVAAVWRHVYPGDLRDIALTLSRDGGRSFQPMARVSEDGWAIDGCPEDGPSLAIDAAGTVHVVWPTVVDAANPQGALFYASTRDGKSFTPRVRIPTLGGPKPEHPTLAIDGKGRLAVAWDEFVRGQHVAAVRTIERHADGRVLFGEVAELGGGMPSAYPVLATTADGMIAVWTSGPSTAASIGVRAWQLQR